MATEPATSSDTAAPATEAFLETKTAAGADVVDDFFLTWKKRRDKWRQREIPMGEGGVPQRFINAEKGNVVTAKERYLKTQKWRETNLVDEVLEQPQPDYVAIKKNIAQFYHGFAKDGRVVYYEVPKKAKIKTLHEQKLSIEKILRHYVHSSEYCWQILDPRELEGRSINIMDATGIGPSDMIGEVRTFMQQILGQSQEHYPERSHLTLIVNAHWTFTGIWNLVKGWMDPATVAKTKIVRPSETAQTLLEYIDKEQLPKEYGGLCECVDPNNPKNKSCRFFSKEELYLLEAVKFFNAKAKESKQAAPPKA
eukprot:gb/GEZN01009342.1/.p1 GENE.gb/GEZN01009342.1/~~gb/GEZN01009342.1/.p1  ORF type:complete len:310 (+),score=55.25 gb/GEZN01009342.1/:236-1165(+)